MTDKITKFRPQTKNVNKHTAYGLRLLEKSLREDGFIDAQTAAADGEIISGSARLEKAVEIFTDKDGVEVEPIIVHSDGTRPVIVIRDDIPNAESARAKRLSVAANKIAQVDFDPDWGLLKDWGAEDAGIKALFSDKEWQEGTGEEKKGGDAEPQIDRAAELQEKWQTASGQLWQLGNHRLLIGDCTVRENVERLMGGERADICWTDPPWNVAYGENMKSDNPQRYKVRTIENDNLGEKFGEFATAFCLSIKNNLKDGGILYMAMSAQEWGTIMQELKNAGFHWSSTIIWNKDHLVMSRKDYHTKYEPIWYGWLDNAPRLFQVEDRKQSDVWDIDRPTKSEEHPTMKPVALVERSLRNSSVVGSVVFEPFGGSGTTIIAAQNLSRRCYACEISEKYGAVILERFATAFPALEIKRLE